MNESELQDIIDSALLPELLEINNESVDDVSLLVFDKKYPQHLYLVCIYGTILEISYGCLALVEKEQLTALPSLLRGILESYSDFKCLLEDPEYYKSMYASQLKEKLRLVRSAKDNPDNPYLAGIADSVDLEADEKRLKSEVAELKKNGHAPLGVWERMAKAEMKGEYQSIYWLLCQHAHNNVSALEERHIEKKGEDYRVVMFKEYESHDLLRYFDSLAAILVEVSLNIHSLLETEAIGRYKEHQSKLDEIRKGYAGNSDA